MGTLFRCALAAALVAGVGGPASAQGARCTRDALSIDGAIVRARFCVPAAAGQTSVDVAETFSALGKTIERTVTLAIVAGADTSRTIDDVDLRPLGFPRTLHVTLAYRAGVVSLEHALALPGAIPVK